MPYHGSLGLALFSAMVGAALVCFLAQALRGEIQETSTARDPIRPTIYLAKIGGSAVSASIIVSFAFYYMFVFALPKPVNFSFRDWHYAMLSNASTEHRLFVGLFGRDYAYQPSISFQGAFIEEETLRNPVTGDYAASPSRLQFHVAYVRSPAFTLFTRDSTFVNAKNPSPSLGGAFFAVQRFTRCTARDLAHLRKTMRTTAVASAPIDTSALLEVRAHKSLIFYPATSAPDLQVMLPAWNDNWIHLKPLEGRGASIGAQEPLSGPARAMILSDNAVYLAVAVPSPALAQARIEIGRSARSRSLPLGNIHSCRHGKENGKGAVEVPWDEVAADDRALLSGFLMEIGPLRDRGGEGLGGHYMVRMENPDSPATLRERLVVPLPNGNVDSLVGGIRAGVVGVSMHDSVGQLEGKFGVQSFSQEFTTSTVAGDDLELRDAIGRGRGLRLRGNARHVSLDERSYYYTFARQLNETVAWTAIAAIFSALLALLMFLWRRVPQYEAAWRIQPTRPKESNQSLEAEGDDDEPGMRTSTSD